MKKKIIIGVLSFSLVFGIGTTVIANTSSNGFTSFQEMLPFMQQMHPGWSDEELESMYKVCHGGANNNSPNGMMGQKLINN